MSTHAKFSPSKLPRIIRCPGSYNASLNIVGTSSKYADEGTMLHKVVEDCLDLADPNAAIEVPESLIKANGLTEDQIKAVQDCLDYVFSLKAAHDDPSMYDLIETKVSLKGYVDEFACPSLADVSGTLDYSLVIKAQRRLYIVDWKFGQGVEVFPESEQTMAYALGKLKNRKAAADFDEVIIVIGQPRISSGEPFKTFHTTPDFLFTWLAEKLVPALNSALSLRPKFSPSKKACMWCLDKNTCKYRRAHAFSVANEVFKHYIDLPDPDMEEILKLVPKFAELRAYMADIELWMINRIKAGKSMPGYKLVSGRSRRKWTDEKVAFTFLLQQGFSESDITSQKMLSAPQMLKLMAAKKYKQFKHLMNLPEFNALIIKPSGKPTLVNDQDKRPALEFKTSKETFKEFI